MKALFDKLKQKAVTFLFGKFAPSIMGVLVLIIVTQGFLISRYHSTLKEKQTTIIELEVKVTSLEKQIRKKEDVIEVNDTVAVELIRGISESFRNQLNIENEVDERILQIELETQEALKYIASAEEKVSQGTDPKTLELEKAANKVAIKDLGQLKKAEVALLGLWGTFCSYKNQTELCSGS